MFHLEPTAISLKVKNKINSKKWVSIWEWKIELFLKINSRYLINLLTKMNLGQIKDFIRYVYIDIQFYIILIQKSKILNSFKVNNTILILTWFLYVFSEGNGYENNAVSMVTYKISSQIFSISQREAYPFLLKQG